MKIRKRQVVIRQAEKMTHYMPQHSENFRPSDSGRLACPSSLAWRVIRGLSHSSKWPTRGIWFCWKIQQTGLESINMTRPVYQPLRLHCMCSNFKKFAISVHVKCLHVETCLALVPCWLIMWIMMWEFSFWCEREKRKTEIFLLTRFQITAIQRNTPVCEIENFY